MKTATLNRVLVRQVLRVLLALAFIGFVTLSVFQLMGKTLFKPETTETVGHQKIDQPIMPVLFLP